MRCGLFGKLPAKRDFIAVSAPRSLLDVWEPWMQSGLSASRELLKGNWQQAYLSAPIWRFWLGAEICGATVMGALMPSLDGVGRYYPLTVFAVADQEAPIPPPDIDSQDGWFAGTEQLLLSTLDRDVSYDTITAELDRLAPPACQASHSASDMFPFIKPGIVAAPAGDLSFTSLCSLFRTANHGSVYAAASFWWTLGGGDYKPAGLSCRGMPDPFLYANILTGRFKVDSGDEQLTG
jgi:type VI secretion system protein ImpM